jgi:glycosyltransferase involved in cell wall biosynthesis
LDSVSAVLQPSVAVVKGSGPVETFILAHAQGLPARVTLIHDLPPRTDGHPILSQTILSRAVRKAMRAVRRRDWDWELTSAYLRAFRRARVDAVLAEFGQTGVTVSEACRRLRVPLIVHFHGADISKHEVLRTYGDRYRTLFDEARAIVAVSKAMCGKLVAAGARAEKVRLNPYGVDCDVFGGASPETAPPVLLAVGRFVEKKAPQVTIRAFAQMHRCRADVRLRMIGDGPLLDECRGLAADLGVASAVTFLGAQPPGVIQQEMRRARAFVQHSVEAASGDAEGTPVAILEAGASGLPVIATRHGGIPDVVIEHQTGLLVDERDVDSMSSAMARLVDEPALAAELGAEARRRVARHFSLPRSLDQLWMIIRSCL